MIDRENEIDHSPGKFPPLQTWFLEVMPWVCFELPLVKGSFGRDQRLSYTQKESESDEYFTISENWCPVVTSPGRSRTGKDSSIALKINTDVAIVPFAYNNCMRSTLMSRLT